LFVQSSVTCQTYKLYYYFTVHPKQPAKFNMSIYGLACCYIEKFTHKVQMGDCETV